MDLTDFTVKANWRNEVVLLLTGCNGYSYNFKYNIVEMYLILRGLIMPQVKIDLRDTKITNIPDMLHM